VIVMKLALACAVHEHVEAAVTAIVPVVAPDPRLVVVVGEPTVTEQADEELAAAGVVLLLHAATANATAVVMPRARKIRVSLISRSF